MNADRLNRTLFLAVLLGLAVTLAICTAAAADETPRINLNTANALQLAYLPNIGEKTAERIVALRARRSFRDVRELCEMPLPGFTRAECVSTLPYLTLSGPTTATRPIPARNAAAYAQPVSRILVKVLPLAPALRWTLRSADMNSCTAWVNSSQPNIGELERAAFRACQEAIDRAVDTAHADAEKGLRP